VVEMLVVGVIGVFEVQPFGKKAAERWMERNEEAQKLVEERSVRAAVELDGSSALRGGGRDCQVR
jgi:hypothetical protein